MIFSKTKFLMAALCLFGISASAQIPQGYEKGLSTISKKELYDNLSYIASDSLKGRLTGSAENFAAARFIAEKFHQYGLKPLYQAPKKIQRKDAEKKEEEEDQKAETQTDSQSDLDLFFQKFNLKESKILDNCSLALEITGSSSNVTHTYSYKTDFFVQFPGNGNLSVEAPIVFAGYGIDKGEKGYSDYIDAKGKTIDVKNKIVIIFDGYPLENDPESIFSKSKDPIYRNRMRKVDIAKEKGALAVIIINSPLKNDPPAVFKYEKSLANFERVIYSLPEHERNEIPTFYINKNVLDDLLNDTKKDVKVLCQSIEKTLKPVSFEIPDKKLKFQINFETHLINTQNVVGLIEGSDPVLKNEFIVVGAHFDHVGFGIHGSAYKKFVGQIHNGADDNGSGTCSLIEIAEAFSKSQPKRSVLIIAFASEEQGMLGSRYFVNEQPLIPLNKTIAMFNLDMIGRNENDLLYVGGAFYSSDLIKIAQRANEKTGFELLYNTGILTSASDQAHFLKKDIPSLFFFGGFHDDYHTPADKIDKVDFDKVEKVAKLAYLSAWITANENEKPKFKETTIDERTQIVKESLIRQSNFLKNKKNNKNN